MRALRYPGASTETQPLIELCCRRIVRTQAEAVEPAPGRLDDLSDQPPAKPEPPIGRQDVQVTHPADARRCRIRIDVEPAHPDHSPAHQGSKKSLAGTIKSIRAAGPLLSEPAQEPPSGLLALSDQGIEGIGRQVVQAFDERGHAMAPPPRAVSGRWASNASRRSAAAR